MTGINCVLNNAGGCYTIPHWAWQHDSGDPHWTQLGPSEETRRQATSGAGAGVNISHSLHRTDWIFRSDYSGTDCHFLNRGKGKMKTFTILHQPYTLVICKFLWAIKLRVSLPGNVAAEGSVWRPGRVWWWPPWQCGQCLPVCQRQRRESWALSSEEWGPLSAWLTDWLCLHVTCVDLKLRHQEDCPSDKEDCPRTQWHQRGLQPPVPQCRNSRWWPKVERRYL